MPSTSPFPIPVSALKPVACGSALWRSGGVLRVTVFVKITFTLTHERTAWPTTTALDLVREERTRDKSPASSLLEAVETAPYLPSAGVILSGHACAPGGRPVPALSARLAIFRDRGLLDKTLHVFGDRPANAPQSPRPFDRMPLIYERAAQTEDNPVGVAPGAPSLPNLVDAHGPTRTAGFGPYGRYWPHRRRLLGNVDRKRLDGVVAEIPDSFDFRWFNPAPPDQQIEFLRGDEWIVLDGMHPSLPRVQSRLPQVRAKACTYLVGPGGPTPGRELDLIADLLVIDADRLLASLVFRGNFALDRLETVPHLRAFADVELPGNPIRWPDAAEVMRAPAPAPVMPAAAKKLPQTTALPAAEAFSTMPLRDEKSSAKAVLPFQPRPPGAPTVLPPNTPPPPPRPRVDLDDDPLMQTRAIDPDEPPSRPAIPFLNAPSGAAAQARAALGAPPPPPPPPRPLRLEDDDGATRAIDLAELEAKRAAATPFERDRGPGSVRPPPPPVVQTPPAMVHAPPPVVPTAPVTVQATPPAVPAPPLRVQAPPAAVPAPSLPVQPTQAAVPAPSLPVQPTPPAVPAPPAMVQPPPPVVPDRRAMEQEPLAPISARGAAPAPAVEETGIRATIVARLRAGERNPLHGLSVTGADLSKLDLAGANLSGHDLGGANFTGANLEGARLSDARLVDADLDGANLKGADLKGADLSRASLANTRLDGATVEGANFSSARGGGACFDGCRGRAPIFARGTWDGASFRALDALAADFSGASLAGAVFEKAVLPEVKLVDAHGKGASFSGARLDQAHAEGVSLTESNFQEIDAKGSTWENATLAGSSFEAARLDNAVLTRATCEGARFKRAFLKGANLGRVQADRACFDGATLDGADLRQARMHEARFEGASLQSVIGGRVDLSRGHFVSADLTNGNFRAALLAGSNLAKAKLDGADLRDADLKRCTLSGASRSGTKLMGANIRDAVDD
ncbi:DUF2169 domain-containing protein [Polyangium spumosum]|uniref:DUF2169 domain-containing protein n=1 Tax=Polyangium spumosum TaxID=889282 RepID=UPI0014782960